MTEEQWLSDYSPDALIQYLVWPGAAPPPNKINDILVRLIKGLISQIRRLVVSEDLRLCDAFEEILDQKSPRDAWGRARSQINVRRDQTAAEVAKVALYSMPRPFELLHEDPRDLVHFESELVKTMRLMERAAALANVCSPPDWKLPSDPWNREFDRALELANRDQASIVRDIFGNPFRPVTLDPRWLSSTVLDLARTIYDERVFERMPILGDALMDAGCDCEEIIKHCQGPGPHVRGCWVVDLILGKA